MKLDELARKVFDSFKVMPSSVYVRVVSFNSTQHVFEFADTMVELFEGSRIYYGDEVDDDSFRADLFRKVQSLVSKAKQTLDGMSAEARQKIEAAGHVSPGQKPEHLIISPVIGPLPKWRTADIEAALKLLRIVGLEGDGWRPGFPAVIIPTCDSDRVFYQKVCSLPQARFGALFFGYKPEEEIVV